MQHKYIEPKDHNCNNPYCPICEGGLSVCSVCGLLEGSLTTECPCVPSYQEYADDVYEGKIDYRNGEWVNKVSRHTPVFYRPYSECDDPNCSTNEDIIECLDREGE